MIHFLSLVARQRKKKRTNILFTRTSLLCRNLERDKSFEKVENLIPSKKQALGHPSPRFDLCEWGRYMCTYPSPPPALLLTINITA